MIIKNNKKMLDKLKEEGFKPKPNQKGNFANAIEYTNGEQAFTCIAGRIHLKNKELESHIRNMGIDFEEYEISESGKLIIKG